MTKSEAPVNEIVIVGDVGGRGLITVFAAGRVVLNTSWEDVGTGGVRAIIELVIELGSALNVPVKDKTT